MLLGLLVSVVTMATAPAVFVQSAPPPAERAPARPSVVGRWRMTVEVESPDRVSLVDLKTDGARVTGTLTAASGTYPLDGEFVDGKLTFSMSYQDLRLLFAAEFRADGTLGGTVTAGQDRYAWAAERVREP